MATMTTTGFEVKCPFCLSEDENVTLDLNTLECNCPGCGSEFTVENAVDEAREQARKWEAVANWLAMVPKAKS